MAKFREKQFGDIRKSVIKNIANPVAIGSLGVGLASYKVAKDNREENRRIRKESAINSQKQLDAMNRLTNALTGVERSMKDYKGPKPTVMPVTHLEDEEDGIVKLRLPKFLRPRRKEERSYTSPMLDNIIQKTWNGAMIGAGVGTLAGAYDGYISDDKKRKAKDRFSDAMDYVGAATLIGAGLGLLVGIVQGIDHKISGRNTYSGNIAEDIRSKLKSSGYVEDKDYTLNPKFANILKTRACLVVSRTSDDLKLLVNTVNDPELKKVTDEVVRGLPRTAVVTENLKNRFNELSISTLSKGAKDTAFVTRVAEMFIKRGMPVYIVEVG